MSLRVRVQRIVPEARDVLAFELVSVDDRPLPQFEPGAHIQVTTPAGMLRSYSLCGDPDDRSRWRIAVQREPGGRGGSLDLHASVREGDLLEVGDPRNAFPLVAGAPSYLLIAGGIGVTPLLSMVHALRRRGADFQLHYCTRSPERTAFARELADPALSGRVHVHHDQGDPALGLNLQRLLATRSPGAQLYCCGPEGLMSAVRNAARAAWPDEALHFESFAASSAGGDAAPDAPFEVVIGSTGKVVPVAADQTILTALRAVGLDVPSSCESGTCGTCLTGLIEGQADHRDAFLSPEEKAEGRQLLVCVSRARSRSLTLEL